MRAPTTSWWWKLTPPLANDRVFGLPTSWNSAARRTTQLGPRVAHDRDRVREHVLVRVDRVLLEPHRVELGEELVGRGRVSARNHSPALGSSTSSSFESSSRMRSALTISSRWRSSLDRVDELGIGLEAELRDEPRRAQHAQRVVEERDLGRERRAQAPRREVDRAAERVDELGLGQPQRHRVDGEVAAREVGLDVVGERDLGLAALGAVDLGAERGDLDRARRPCGSRRCRSAGPGATRGRPTAARVARRRRAGRRW